MTRKVFYSILLLLFMPICVASEDRLVSAGIVAGSIRDIDSDVQYIDWWFDWRAMTGAPGNIDLLSEQVADLKKYLQTTVKNQCSKYKEKYKKVFYGIDNVTLSTRHFETQQSLGSSTVASFNGYCAIK